MKTIFLFMFICAFNSFSQYKTENYFEGNVSFAKNKNDINFNWHHFHPLSKNKKLKFGYGVRFTSFFGKNQFYSSAPAQIVKNTSGPAVLFSKKMDANLDSVFVNNPQVNFLNVFVLLQYTFAEKLDLGFNIDLIGFGFGKSHNSIYINKNTNENISNVSYVSNFNLLLIDVNDRGNLKSELYVRYWITKKWAAKIALSHLFTEINTEVDYQKNPENNNRFRLISDLVSVGVTFKPW